MCLVLVTQKSIKSRHTHTHGNNGETILTIRWKSEKKNIRKKGLECNHQTHFFEVLPKILVSQFNFANMHRKCMPIARQPDSGASNQTTANIQRYLFIKRFMINK